MIVTKYYNQFLKHSQYSRVESEDVMYLIVKFTTHIQPAIKDKMSAHRFNTPVDFFAIALLAKNSIESRFQER